MCLLPSRLPLVTPWWTVSAPPKTGGIVKAGWPMDSLQSPPTGQRHKAEKDQFGAEPTALKDPPEGPMGDPDFWYASPTIAQNVDVSAEETCPAPSAQMAPQAEPPQPAPAIQPAQVPSATTFALMDQLEALASDLVDKERAASDQSIGGSDPAISNKESGNSSELPAVEPTIRVSPRPSGVETDQFAFDRPSLGGRTAFALASVFAVALVGAAPTYAWQ